MIELLLGLRVPYRDPLEKLAMEAAAKAALKERGVIARVEIVGDSTPYIAVQGGSLEDAQRLADIAEEAAMDVYGR